MIKQKTLLFTGCLVLLIAGSVFAKDFKLDEGGSVELNGDKVEYVMEENKFLAEGNVIVQRGSTKLYCDKVEFFRTEKKALAEGNVILETEEGRLTGQALDYSFEDMSGVFKKAKIFANPYYGYGDKLSRVSENHILMTDGYLTTSDFDDPEYRLKSKSIDIYPEDRAVGKHMKLFVGKIPVMYFPKFTHRLDDKRPRYSITPGKSKDFGYYALQKWRYWPHEHIEVDVKFDYREKKDAAVGIDVAYNALDKGSGILRTYYMNERNVQSKHFYDERPSPTIEKERFKVEWRHKWDIDEKTNAIMQYSKLSDDGFLKDYFEYDNKKDPSPETYFLVTRILDVGTLSFRTDKRVNRYESKVERLPEVNYQLSNQEVGGSGFYLKSSSTFSNLNKKYASPTERNEETVRFDTDNEVSYPVKVSFLEVTPFVGGRNTYYSRAKDPEDYDSLRGIFKAGSSVSTKFYRVFDIKDEFFGMEVHRLRHIITPSANYLYQHDPTIQNTKLDQFDGIDSLTRDHTISLSLENKLQTKRNNKNIELLRSVVDTPFRLEEYPGKGGFDTITSTTDFKPMEGVTFSVDTNYNTHADHLQTYNTQLNVNPGEKWDFNIEKRWQRDVDDQITAEWEYTINPKWKFRVYEVLNADIGLLKEQEYSLTRDLHSWELDINFNQTRGQGNEVWLVFRLKAFPDTVVEGGSSFNKRKAGSQNSEGE